MVVFLLLFLKLFLRLRKGHKTNEKCYFFFLYQNSSLFQILTHRKICVLHKIDNMDDKTLTIFISRLYKINWEPGLTNTKAQRNCCTQKMKNMGKKLCSVRAYSQLLFFRKFLFFFVMVSFSKDLQQLLHL